MLTRFLVLTLLVMLSSPFAVAQQAKRPLTPADKAMLKMPAGAQLSPDGKLVAFTVREADTMDNSWHTQVYLVETETGAIQQATFGKSNCSDPQWSPDGRWLGFLSARKGVSTGGETIEGRTALYVFPDQGGEARLIAAPPRNIEEYAWSPDGQKVAMLIEAEAPEEFRREAAARTARKLNITVSSDPKTAKEMWVLDVSSKTLRNAAELDAGAQSLAWFPDGTKLVYQSNYTGDYNDEQKFDLWSVTLSGSREQLTDVAGPETAAQVSPDGTVIAFVSQTVPDIEFAKTELSLLDVKSKQLRRLTEHVPLSVEEFRWDPDSKSLIALVNDGSTATLHRVSRSAGTTEKLTDRALVVDGFSINASGDVAFVAEGVAKLKDIHMLDRGGVRQLTAYSDQLAPFVLGDQRVITVRSRDGLYSIEAVLVLPTGYDGKARLPLLLAYHGGPYGDFDNRFFQYYPAHILAAKGIATVMPNVRGSSGYDDAFGQANRYDLGGGDYRDAMDVVDWLIRQGIADSSRMAVCGGSYGGYMTNWTISQTARFKAAVSMFGIFSWLTDWSNSWQPAFEKMFLGHDYWEKPLNENSLWISRAPQTYVRDITTPTLILQGDKDRYTNISNSREMYQALKALGREVEFVVYHGAGHGLRTYPTQWIDSMERTVQWVTERIGK